MRTKIAIVLWGLLLGLSYGATVRDVSWKCETSQCFLQFDFDPAAKLPSYFQTYDGANQVLKVGFAQTNSRWESQEFAINAQATGVQGVAISTEKSKKGTPLLIFAFKVGSQITSANNTTALHNDHLFRINFSSKATKTPWVLSKLKPTVPKTETNVAATSAPPKAETKVAPQVAPPASAAPVAKRESAPAIAENKAKNAHSAAGQTLSGISRVSWHRGYGVEHFYFEFSQPLKALPTLAQNNNLSLVVEEGLTFARVVVDSSTIVKGFRMAKGALNTGTLHVELKTADLQVMVRDNLLLLQKIVPYQVQMETWNWGPTKAELKVFYNHDGDVAESLESFAQQFQKKPGVETFMLKSISKDLIVVADKGTAFRENPNGTSSVIRELPFGTKLTEVELVNNLFYKVQFGKTVGFVNRREVSPPHELSQKQTEKLKELASKAKDSTTSEDGLGNFDFAFSDEMADRISYQSFGRRDPFIPLQGVVADGINIDGVELVGIIWEPESPMVILSDTRNPHLSYTLKEGDAILNGKVLKITPDEVLFIINEVGVSRRYTMTLPDKYGGKK